MANKTVVNLSGGMNFSTNPVAVDDIQCELIRNYKLDTVGSLVKRNGYDTFATQPVPAKPILGLAQYTNTATAAETTQVMVVNNAGGTNAVIYWNNAGTWETSKTDDTAVATPTNFNRSRFITFVDYLFRINGIQITASSINVNGDAWGTTNCPATITPTFGEVFKDRVYLGRNGTTNASRLYWSDLPDSTGAVDWDTTNNYVDINPDDGDEMTALENNGNRLLIFKNRAMYRWDFGMTEPDRLIGIGTESQECVKTNLDLGVTFFANSKGIYAYTGGRPKIISRRIQPFIDAVPAANWNDCVGETDADHYYCYLSDSLTVRIGDKDEDRTFTNIMVVYTISLDAWTIYTLDTPWRVGAKLILSGAEEIYFGNSTGRTYKWDSGNSDDSAGTDSDEAAPIGTEIITKEQLLVYPTMTNLKFIDIISKDAFNVQLFYQMDRKGDFEKVGRLTKRFFASPLIGKNGRSVRIKLTDIGTIPHRIDGYNIEHEPNDQRK